MEFTVFKLPIGYRLYDRERNKIVTICEGEYHALKRLLKGCGTQDDEAVLGRFQKNNFCCDGTLTEIEHPAASTIDRVLQKNVSQMVLQVTQNCNLRCSYCAYSGSYYNRKHNNKRMDEQTALRAVDFIMSHSSDVEEITIGFYGGEPFLEYELIKKVVRYVKEVYPEKKVRFNLTTNMTLVSDEIIDYITKNNIEIMISIDGPESVQDKYRVFASGQGSYAKVAKNVGKLCEKDVEYYGKCMTNTVLSPGCDCEAVRDFLDHDELFSPLTSMVTQVNDVGLKEQIEYDDSYYTMMRREKFKLLLAMLGEIGFDKVSKVARQHMATILQTHQMLKTKGTDGLKSSHPGGPCVPGKKRVFVDVDGKFYPCERISEYEEFQIGNLDDGFDYDRIRKMLNVGKCSRKECLDCWAFLYCGTCIANMTEEGTATKAMRMRRCPGEKNNLISQLSDVEIMKHYGFDFVQMEEEK